MQLKIKIDLDNDAFMDWNTVNFDEVKRILRTLDFSDLSVDGDRKGLYDYNGNHVGWIKLEE